MKAAHTDIISPTMSIKDRVTQIKSDMEMRKGLSPQLLNRYWQIRSALIEQKANN